MKALVQRVQRSSVMMDGQVAGRIGRGFVVLLGVKGDDTEKDARYLAQKTANLRVFPDADGKMNISLQDIRGEVLVVSQFTLYADTRKGNRPSFVQAAPPEKAEALYKVYVDSLRKILDESRVATGMFRAMMLVEIVNDGPVTIELRSEGNLGDDSAHA
ncbi:MAG: D-aminoacyl-tRNA deacylase [Verrucomicrobiota bacterium]|nr:D-aminoacyl-tRNA deacylase [Verrucomicrobiota bacterium]